MISHTYERTFDTDSDGTADEPQTTPATFDQRLNRILSVATAVIAREGYHKASMRTVAKAAGVSLAGMYHYFDSKERMLFLIQFRTFNSLLNGLKEKLHGVDDPLEQLRVMVRSHIGYFAANMDALQVCSHELDTLKGEAYEETRRIRHEYYELTRTIVRRLLEAQSEGRALDQHIATMCLFGTLNWLYRWYDPKKDRSPAALANHIVEQFLYGVAGPGAKRKQTA